jgi:hypothetical protein
MARAELIPTMTEDQLDTNLDYARRRHEDSPEHTHWALFAELCEIQKHFNATLEEYREAARREMPMPVAPQDRR